MHIWPKLHGRHLMPKKHRHPTFCFHDTEFNLHVYIQDIYSFAVVCSLIKVTAVILSQARTCL